MPATVVLSQLTTLVEKSELLDERAPNLATFPDAYESTSIADYYEALAGSGE